MAVLTCAEMVEQCLRGQAPGWKRFVTHYVPVAAAVLDRHFPHQAARREEFLRKALLQTQDQEAQFFRAYQGQSDREFLLHLREHAVRVGEQAAPPPGPEIPLGWDVFQNALRPCSILDRQIVWTAVLGPRYDDVDRIFRLAAGSVNAALEKAQDALRAACDRWSATMLFENRHLLQEQARARRTERCPPARQFLRLLDGQITWRDRQELERHLSECWHCVDLLCRSREVIYLAGGVQPLAEAAAEPYLRLLGLEAPAGPRWRRWIEAR